MNAFSRLAWIGPIILAAIVVSPAAAEDVAVTGIRAVHRSGQTFVTWNDAAEGEAGAKHRYSLYRSERPITADNLAEAELCFRGVLHSSAKLYGAAFSSEDRLDPTRPYATMVAGGAPLPPWSGLAVYTVRRPGKAYYAVVATDLAFAVLSRVVPGESATTEPVDETPAPIQHRR